MFIDNFIHLPKNYSMCEEFKIFKKRVISSCKKKKLILCTLGQLSECKTFDSFWLVILSNYRWFIINGVVAESERPKEFIFPKCIRENLNFRRANLSGITLPEIVDGCLDLSGCEISDTILPIKVNVLTITANLKHLVSSVETKTLNIIDEIN